jgi:hypothetical protein
MQKINLDEFTEILKSTDLLPGRKTLLNDLDLVMDRFKQHGINNLSGLQTQLKKKSDYTEMATVFQVEETYLIVLNREVNSYLSKSLDLAKLMIFKVPEMEQLKNWQISNTKEFYQKLQTKASRIEISEMTNISPEKILKALQMADLLRVNGVGPVFAGLLLEMGICSVMALLDTPAHKIVEGYQLLIEKQGLSLPNLGQKDILYCQRFAMMLDQDIEW